MNNQQKHILTHNPCFITVLLTTISLTIYSQADSGELNMPNVHAQSLIFPQIRFLFRTLIIIQDDSSLPCCVTSNVPVCFEPGTPCQINKVLSHPTLPITITAQEDRHIKFFDNNSGKLIHSMVAHLDAVTSLAVDPNGLYLMSGSKYLVATTCLTELFPLCISVHWYFGCLFIIGCLSS